MFGTTNYYGEVEVFVGAMNDAYTSAGRELIERFRSEELIDVFRQMVDDWTNESYDPFAAPMETGTPWGTKKGSNNEAVSRQRVTAQRMVGLAGDAPKRSDETDIRSTVLSAMSGRMNPKCTPSRDSRGK